MASNRDPRLRRAQKENAARQHAALALSALGIGQPLPTSPNALAPPPLGTGAMHLVNQPNPSPASGQHFAGSGQATRGHSFEQVDPRAMSGIAHPQSGQVFGEQLNSGFGQSQRLQFPQTAMQSTHVESNVGHHIPFTPSPAPVAGRNMAGLQRTSTEGMYSDGLTAGYPIGGGSTQNFGYQLASPVGETDAWSYQHGQFQQGAVASQNTVSFQHGTMSAHSGGYEQRGPMRAHASADGTMSTRSGSYHQRGSMQAHASADGAMYAHSGGYQERGPMQAHAFADGTVPARSGSYQQRGPMPAHASADGAMYAHSGGYEQRGSMQAHTFTDGAMYAQSGAYEQRGPMQAHLPADGAMYTHSVGYEQRSPMQAHTSADGAMQAQALNASLITSLLTAGQGGGRGPESGRHSRDFPFQDGHQDVSGQSMYASQPLSALQQVLGMSRGESHTLWPSQHDREDKNWSREHRYSDGHDWVRDRSRGDTRARNQERESRGRPEQNEERDVGRDRVREYRGRRDDQDQRSPRGDGDRFEGQLPPQGDRYDGQEPPRREEGQAPPRGDGGRLEELVPARIDSGRYDGQAPGVNDRYEGQAPGVNDRYESKVSSRRDGDRHKDQAPSRREGDRYEDRYKGQSPPRRDSDRYEGRAPSRRDRDRSEGKAPPRRDEDRNENRGRDEVPSRTGSDVSNRDQEIRHGNPSAGGQSEVRSPVEDSSHARSVKTDSRSDSHRSERSSDRGRRNDERDPHRSQRSERSDGRRDDRSRRPTKEHHHSDSGRDRTASQRDRQHGDSGRDNESGRDNKDELVPETGIQAKISKWAEEYFARPKREAARSGLTKSQLNEKVRSEEQKKSASLKDGSQRMFVVRGCS